MERLDRAFQSSTKAIRKIAIPIPVGLARFTANIRIMECFSPSNEMKERYNGLEDAFPSIQDIG